MNRELLMAAVCAIATIALAWVFDNPNKVGGSIFVLVILAIIAGSARYRGDSSLRVIKWKRGRRPPPPQN